MNLRTLTFIAGLALLTALTLAGSIFGMFYLLLDVLAISTMHDLSVVNLLLGLSALVLPFFGGWLWGAGIALVARRPYKTLARGGMLSWGTGVLVAGVLLGLSQTPIFAVVGLIGFSKHIVHYLFTLVFVPAVGLVTLLSTNKIVERLGLIDGAREAGRLAGLAAAGAFLIVSLALLFGFGWEVAGPYAGRRYSMISIMHVCNFAAALAAGSVLGWTLSKFRPGPGLEPAPSDSAL